MISYFIVKLKLILAITHNLGAYCIEFSIVLKFLPQGKIHVVHHGIPAVRDKSSGFAR
jgi:hypothetical protein